MPFPARRRGARGVLWLDRVRVRGRARRRLGARRAAPASSSTSWCSICATRSVRAGRRRGDDFERGLRLLDAMDSEADIERRYGFHASVALVSGDVTRRKSTRASRPSARTASVACCATVRWSANCTRAAITCRRGPRLAKPRARRNGRQIAQHRHGGKGRSALSGGGITGLYFELGALKCFEDCCSPRARSRARPLFRDQRGRGRHRHAGQRLHGQRVHGGDGGRDAGGRSRRLT